MTVCEKNRNMIIQGAIIFFIMLLFIKIPSVFAQESYTFELKDVYTDERIECYKKAIKYYNPSLDSNTTERIARSIIYFSWKQKIEDDRFVASVIAVESMFRPYAVSRSGAQGLGQLMPGTARELSVKNSFDVEDNIWGTVTYLKKQLVRYKNYPRQRRYELTLAAYNAGPGAVSRHCGIPPYKQTQEYVVKVINIWRQLSGLKKFSPSEMAEIKRRVAQNYEKSRVKVEIKTHYEYQK